MTSNMEANSETAGLVLLAYQYNAWKTNQQETVQQALSHRETAIHHGMICYPSCRDSKRGVPCW